MHPNLAASRISARALSCVRLDLILREQRCGGGTALPRDAHNRIVSAYCSCISTRLAEARRSDFSTRRMRPHRPMATTVKELVYCWDIASSSTMGNTCCCNVRDCVGAVGQANLVFSGCSRLLSLADMRMLLKSFNRIQGETDHSPSCMTAMSRTSTLPRPFVSEARHSPNIFRAPGSANPVTSHSSPTVS